jgi:hypothetical protein
MADGIRTSCMRLVGALSSAIRQLRHAWMDSATALADSSRFVWSHLLPSNPYRKKRARILASIAIARHLKATYQLCINDSPWLDAPTHMARSEA